MLTTLVTPAPAYVLAWTSLDSLKDSGSFSLAGGVYTGNDLADSNDGGRTAADASATLNYDGNNQFDEKEITLLTSAFCGFTYGQATAKEVTSNSSNPSNTNGRISRSRSNPSPGPVSLPATPCRSR